MMHTDPLSQMMEAACEAAIKRLMHVSDVSPRRFIDGPRIHPDLSLSEREVYNMISERQLGGVRYGKPGNDRYPRPRRVDPIAQSSVMTEKRLTGDTLWVGLLPRPPQKMNLQLTMSAVKRGLV